MLEVGENFVVLHMDQNVPANNVLKKFTGNTSQRNWYVVFSQDSDAFFENWCNVSQRPVPWKFSSVKTLSKNSNDNYYDYHNNEIEIFFHKRMNHDLLY